MRIRLLPLIEILWRGSRRSTVLIAACSTLSGLLSAGVIAFVGAALGDIEHATWLMGLGFMGLVVAKIVTNALSRGLLVRLSEDTILSLSISVCGTVLRAPLRQIERRGIGQIHTSLTDDVSSVTWAVQCLPMLVTNAAVVAGCVTYLAILSWKACLVVVIITALGALSYKFIEDRAIPIYWASREARSKLFGLFAALTSGIKELLMHQRRRQEFLEDELRAAGVEYRRNNLAATQRHIVGDAWTQLLFYGLIGIAIFGLKGVLELSAATLTSYVFGLLYMMAPTWSMIGAIPAVHRGSIALESIERLGSLEGDQEPEELVSARSLLRSGVEMRRVTFSYGTEGEGDRPFHLGPLDFELAPGELVFIIGGNGSGKSTFLKLLVGLYPHASGEILIDGRRVDSAHIVPYREHFSVVFADFHLFERPLGLLHPELDKVAEHYLNLLQLNGKVQLRDGRFSSLRLSQGQRKRLALLIAYLEDRPVFVFDEWAADQDPEYKRIFYTQLLPDLRSRGKAVVVITHDDSYFHLGDRVIKLDEGNIVQTWKPELEKRAVVS